MSQHAPVCSFMPVDRKKEQKVVVLFFLCVLTTFLTHYVIENVPNKLEKNANDIRE